MNRALARAVMLLAGCSLLAPAACRAEDPAPPASLITNGGFEDWAALDPGVAASDGVKNVMLSPPGQAPVGWMPMRELCADHPQHTGTVALDEVIHHSGARSVRIDNGDMRDITLVQYSTEPFSRQPADPHNIQPSRRYLLRWWVKGQGVEPSGTGPIMMMFTESEDGGKWARTDDYERGALLTGTFDWQPRQFTFITDEHARWANFTFQLRWTTGTIWYEDVELLDRGPVVNVETY